MKVTWLNLQNEVFLLAKNRYYLIITLKMLKIKLKIEYTRLTKKGQRVLADYEKSKQILGLNFGKS